MGSLTLTVLVDDEPGSGAARAEHGLSIWIEAGGLHVLFDAGQGTAARGNARLLGIDISKAEAVAVSHGHYDHTGGLPYVLADCPRARLFLHPGALDTRYTRSPNGSVRSIGYPHRAEELIAGRSAEVVRTRTATEIASSIFMTGEIPRLLPPESPQGRFFLDAGCRVPDPLLDDQAFVFDTDEGAIVILGCSHAGVWNTVSYALGKSRSGKLRALIGGMHLADAQPQEIARLAYRLAELSPSVICPCHCTGRRGKEILKSGFPNAYREACTGTTIAFD